MSKEAVAAVYIFLLLVGFMTAFSVQAAVKGRFVLKWLLWAIVAAGFILLLLTKLGAQPIDGTVIVAALAFGAIGGVWGALGGVTGIAVLVSERLARKGDEGSAD